MNQSQFRQLLHRYTQGDCTPEENHLIEQWFEKIERQSGDTLSPQERELVKARMLQNIMREARKTDHSPIVTKKTIRISPITWNRSLGIAASLLLLITLTWYGWQRENPGSSKEQQPVAEKEAGLIEYTNTSSGPSTINLPDHSQVVLTPGSSLFYPRNFTASKREVHLKGNAFFEVHKDPRKPFLVYCGSLVTQVLGTSFWVKSPNPAHAVEVEVKTGRVSVFERKTASTQTGTSSAASGVVLTPNQKVTYFSQKHHLVTSLVERPIPVNQTRNHSSLVFTETPLPMVLQELQKQYAIEILLAHDKLQNCTVTGDLTGMSYFEQMEVICEALNASYEVKGTRLLIKGNGCD